MNLALKSSFGSKELPLEFHRILNKMHSDFVKNENLNECIISTQSNGWIVGKKYDNREFYVVFENRSSNIQEITNEVKQLSNQFFHNIFMY